LEFNNFPLVGQKVAIIPVKGEITSGGCGGNILTGGTECADVSTIEQELTDADKDDSIRAIVLDINSGGGGVIPSKELATAVKNEKKPVVACIGEEGASGAYYIASAADRIVADRNSITGSIGVIMSFDQVYGLYKKLGLNVTVIKSGNMKDIGSPYRPMTDGERADLQKMVDEIYSDFVSDVATNRNLSYEYVRSISDGSIYLGRDAKNLGLVDDLGNLDYAVTVASDLGNISGPPSVERTKPKSFNVWDYLAGAGN
jgi:protease-4